MPDVRIRYGDMRELAPLLRQLEYSALTRGRVPGPSESEVRATIMRAVARIVVDQDVCHDCRVDVGELHVRGCDAEVCAGCLGQAIACDCVADPVNE